MLSAWDVYWVMQLDSINAGAAIIGVFGTAFGAIGTGVFTVAVADGEEWAPPVLRLARRVLGVGVLCAIAAVFLPSTKTAAAMIVVPAIANNQTLQREAGELYTLAKDALREAIKPDGAAKASDPEK